MMKKHGTATGGQGCHLIISYKVTGIENGEVMWKDLERHEEKETDKQTEHDRERDRKMERENKKREEERERERESER